MEKEARSDMSRKVEAEARRLGEDVVSESSARKKSSVVPWQRSRGRPRQGAGKGAGCHSGRAKVRVRLRLQSENELLKGKVKLLEDRVVDRDA